MHNVDVTQNAFAFAFKAHYGQTRKYTEQPYILHPIAVADLVRNAANKNTNMVAAAYLHDVLEDTNTKTYELMDIFGNEITQLVIELTDVFIHPHQGNRATRKELERKRLSQISPEAQTVKVADLIDNTASITKYDPKFGKVYLAEKALLLPLLDKADRKLLQFAMNQLENRNDYDGIRLQYRRN